MRDALPRLFILGTRGIPAAHGGFETFAERLALHLVAEGWQVSVYCQIDSVGGPRRIWTDEWRGVERIHVDVGMSGPKATLEFDGLSAWHAAERDGVCLVLGYNGAVFLPYLRLRGRKVMTNMDGIEWRRPKWGRAVKGWFYVNEAIAARSSHRLVADHPEIARYLAGRFPTASIVTIPYGGDKVADAPEEPVRALGLEPDRYLYSVSRIEPDNNILSMVRAFSRQPRGLKLVVIGNVDPSMPYGRAIREAAGREVVFPGTIYNPKTLGSLRFHARAYMHGHMAGGTNPSLVEALWAGNAVVAHDNPYNRWTADGAGLYFRDDDECATRIATVTTDRELVQGMRFAARSQAAVKFDWAQVFAAYERELVQLSVAGVPQDQLSLAWPRRRSV